MRDRERERERERMKESERERAQPQQLTKRFLKRCAHLVTEPHSSSKVIKTSSASTKIKNDGKGQNVCCFQVLFSNKLLYECHSHLNQHYGDQLRVLDLKKTRTD